MKIENLFNQSKFDLYTAYLKSTGISDASIKRKLSSPSTFQKFLVKKGHIQNLPLTPPFKGGVQINSPFVKGVNRKGFFKKIFTLTHQGELSEKLRGFKNKKLFNYLLLVSLLIISSAIGYGFYSQSIKDAKSGMAYSTASSPVFADRFLSFQGRLTDSAGNPITSSTSIQFDLFDTEAVGTGTSLYTSATGNSQVVVPDENGIFSVTIGKTHGVEIPNTIFSENAAVWLQITAGSETMSPRQPIATVAYAINAETLQGLPPSASGLKDTVLVIDTSGNLNLGETSPSIVSTSGTLGIEGQAILIKASDSSGGNIEINPDANGIIKLTTEGSGSTAVNGFIDATNANLSTGNLYSATIRNENRSYNFLDFRNYDVGTTLLTTRFSVDAYGNAYTQGTLSATTISIGNTNVTSTAAELNLLDGTLATAGSVIYGNGSNLVNTSVGTSGQLLMSNASGAPTWIDANSSNIGTSYSAGNGLTLSSTIFKLGGALTENTNLSIGNNSTFFINATNGNIGLGTTNPSYKLHTIDTSNTHTTAIYGHSYQPSTSTDYRKQGVVGQVNGIHTNWGYGTGVMGIADPDTLWGAIGVYAGLDSTIPSIPQTISALYADGKSLGYSATFTNGDVHINGSNLKIANSVGEAQTTLLSYDNATSFWMIQPQTSQKLVIADQHSWDRSVSIEYTPGTTEAGDGRLVIGQIDKNSTNYTHGITSLYTNGIERLRINSNGNVGIGTISPTEKLEITGNIKQNSDTRSLTISEGSTITGSNHLLLSATASYLRLEAPNNYIQYNADTGHVFSDGTGNTEWMRISYTGNIGIGTTSPSYKLDVVGDGSFSTNLNVGGTLTLSQGATDGYILQSDASGNASWASISSIGSGVYVPYTNATGDVDLGSYNLYATKIGIGTTNPNAPLHIANTLGSWAGIELSTASAPGGFWLTSDSGNVNLWNNDNTDMIFANNGSEKMRINSSGNVGISTINPQQKLDVNGKIAINGQQTIYDADALETFYKTLYIGNGGNNLSHTANDEGYYNTAIGIDSLSNNTTGYRNSAVGANSLINNTTGYYNTAIGTGSLYNNIDGNYNTAIGMEAISGGSGDYNTAIGFRTLYSNTTGSNNVAMGESTLMFNSTGSSNIAIGSGAMYYATTGSYNIGIGGDNISNYGSGAGSTGNYNVALGHGALSDISSGEYNLGLGIDSLFYNETGLHNIGLGYNAGIYLNGGSHNTSPDYSMYLGYDTRSGNASGDAQNEIVIGYNTRGLGSNSIVLGNDSITTTALKGNVGIGTTSPTAKLEISKDGGSDITLVNQNTATNIGDTLGAIKFRTEDTSTSGSIVKAFVQAMAESTFTGGDHRAMLIFGTSNTTNEASTKMTLNSSGYLGLGTTSPSYTLDVVGNGSFSTNLNIGGTITLSQGATSGYILTSDASGHASWASAAGLVSGTYVPYTGATGDINLNNKALFNVSKVAIGLGSTSSYELDINGKIAINVQQTIYNAGALNSNFNQSLFFGNGGNSLSHTTGNEAYYNTGIGSGALFSNTTGNSNSAQGVSSLYYNTTGTYNVAQGVYSLVFNTTGSSNLGQGYAALYSNKTGSNGTAIGHESQRYANDTTTPWTNYNTSIGFQALRGSTTAANNTGNYNTAIGYATMLNNTNGGDNTALGYNSLNSNNNGYGNTAIGKNTLLNVDTGGQNTSLGNNAGRYYNGTTGNLTSASQSLFLGASSSALADGNTNETVIGYNAIGNGSNSVTLGNDSVTKTILKGNVGIGTTNPSKSLEIVSSSNAAQLRLRNTNANYLSGIQFDDETGTDVAYMGFRNNYDYFQTNIGAYDYIIKTNWTDRLIVKSTGSVGIGTTNPGYKLDVIGDGSFSTNLSVGGTLTISQGAGLDYLFVSDASGNGRWADPMTLGLGTTYAVTNGLTTIGSTEIFGLGGFLTQNTDIGFSGFSLTFSDAGSTFASFSATNNTFYNPTTFMSSGDVSMAYDLNFTNATSATIRSSSPLYIQTESPYANLDLNLTAANSGKIYLNSDTEITNNLSVGGTLTLPQGASNGYVLASDASGNAYWSSISGVGVTDTLATVTARGASTSTMINLLGGAYFGSTNQSILKNDGSVGIGTTNPSHKLDIIGDGYFSSSLSVGSTVLATNLNADLLDGYHASDILQNSVYYVEGNDTGTAGTWTGSISGLDSYYDGLVIAYKIGIAGASTTTLDINGLGAVVARRDTSNLTTHLPVGTVALFTYTTISGTPYWVWADYDSNNYDRIAWWNNITAGTTIYDYKLLMQAADGKWYPLTLETGTGTSKTISTQEFNISSPILYYNSSTDIAINSTTNNVYSEYPMSTLAYTANQASWTDQLPIYLKGTINSSGNFVLDNTTSTSFMTQSLPTTDDGFVYILLGQMYSTAYMRLYQYHPMYQYKFGKVQLYNSTSDLFVLKTGDTISGNLSIGGTLTLTQGASAGYILQSDASGHASWVSASGLGGGTYYAGSGLTLSGSTFKLGGALTENTNLTIGSTSAFFINSTTGNVGIGTTSPSQKLEVVGSGYFATGGSNTGTILLNVANAGSPQISMSDNAGDNSWAIGADDADNYFKIAGNSSASIPTINNIGTSIGTNGLRFYVDTSSNLYTGSLNANSGSISGALSVGTTLTVNTLAATRAQSTTVVTNLNADLLDGLSSLNFIQDIGTRNNTDFDANTAIGLSKMYRPGANATNLPGTTYGTLLNLNNSDTNQQLYLEHGGDSAGAALWFRADNGSTMDAPWSQIWGSLNDGSGTGLDADLLDGLHASSFLQSTDLANYVTGPTSSTDNAIARFNGTTGKIIQNSGVTIDDSNNLTVSGDIIANLVTGKNILPFQYASWEYGSDGDIIPASKAADSLTISTDTSADGTRSIKQVSTSTDDYAYLGGTSTTTYDIPIQPSTKYILSAYAKAASGSIPVQIYARTNNSTQNHYGGSATATTSWTRVQVVFTSASDATAMLIRTDVDATGTVYFDKFMLEQVPSSQTTASTWTPSSSFNGLRVDQNNNLIIMPGNVGIGTTSPTQKLEVAGIIYSTDGGTTANNGAIELMDDSGSGKSSIYGYNGGLALSSFDVGSTNPHMVIMNGSVGIGTTSPGQKLQVEGNVDINGRAYISNGIDFSSGDLLTFDDSNSVNWGGVLPNISSAWTFSGDGNSAITSYGAEFNYLNVNNNAWIGGSLGIGTSSPLAPLHIGTTTTTTVGGQSLSSLSAIFTGSIASTKFYDADNPLYFVDPAVNDSNYSSLSLAAQGSIKFNVTDTSGSAKYIGNYAASRIQGHTNGLSLDVGTAASIGVGNTVVWNNSLFLASSGNVGIGTTNPTAKLEVGGAASVISNTAGDITINAASNNISFSGDSIININNGIFAGKIGIGTTNPLLKLQVTGAGGFTTGFDGMGNTYSNRGLTGGGVEIGYDQANNIGTIASLTENIAWRPMNYQAASHNFFFSGASTAGVAFTSSGSVGIGTINPNDKLDIRGQLGINGTGGEAGWLQIWADNNDDGPAVIFDNDRFLRFGTWNSYTGKDGWNELMRLTASGKVGIGTASPNTPLQVSGEITSTLGTYGQVRMISGNYGAFFRNDGVNTYLLLTASGDQYGSWNGLRPWYVNNSTGYVTFGNGHNDLAENYMVDNTVLRGGIVSIGSVDPWTVTNSDSSHKSLVGVISTTPGAVMDADGGYQIGADTKAKYINEKAPIALVGTAPTLVTNQNGTIDYGDSISISNTPGFGAKSISAGQIVGKALQEFNPNDSICQSVNSIDEINWPDNDGKNEQKPCYKLPDGTYVGKIMVAINVTWYDPDVYLTSTGQVNINYNVSDEVLASLGYDDTKNEIESTTYSLIDSLGNTITRISQFTEITTAKIKAGLISATNIITDNAVIKNLKSKKIETDQLLSPLADIDFITSQDIQSTSVTTNNLTADEATVSSLIAENIESEKLTSNELISREATISTLYADQIISKDGTFGDIMANKISALRDELTSLVASNETEATPSAIALESENWALNISQDYATIEGNLNLTDNLVIGAQLMVNGDTQLGNAFVIGQFTAGEITIADNYIQTMNNALYIQPNNTGSVHIMGETLIISDTGDVRINGNITVTGSLFANLLDAAEIRTEKLTAAEINSDKINIATDSGTIIADSNEINLATSSAQINSNATAGTTTLPVNTTEITIYTNQLTTNSMVYLTPVGSTNNQVIYVKEKTDTYFTIALDQPLDHNISINWWIIN